MSHGDHQFLTSGVARAGARGGIAVLVDGENISAKAVADELGRAIGHVPVAVRRVYGNAVRLSQWEDVPEFQLVHTGSGKNSADMRLSIDAVQLSYAGGIGTFVLVSSDGDFSHLAHHLRERHLRVLGIGRNDAAKKFRAACAQFFEIETDSVTKPASKKLCAMDGKIRDAIRKNGDQNGLPIQRLGVLMNAHGIKISSYPEKTWRGYLTKRPGLYACDPKGAKAKVRWIGG